MIKHYYMKAKTKKRIRHVLTKKKLVSKSFSHKVLRTFLIGVATISFGSLAYAITLNKPVITVSVHSSGPGGRTLNPAAPAVTPRIPGAPDQVGRGSWYALGLPAPDALSCASKTFSRGSYLEVKDMYNGHTVVCHVNDYGPEAWTGRVIDLSRGSFSAVDDLGRGTIPVEIRQVGGPVGFNLPIVSEIGSIIGYQLCSKSHPFAWCDDHRQE